ncbi:MAG: hypothetical protein JO257_25095 [Deltaproteobacteria bacterium]|nr:hypothetical protein [Deltaproteobacteria bacterium]
MRSLLLVAALASVAHAQAPGQTVQTAPGVIDRRWSVDLALGPTILKAKTDGAKGVLFLGLELAARFRIRREVEVALAFDAAGNQGIGLVGFFAEGRYRFNAERAWNPFVLVSLGVESVADKTGSSTEKQGRGALRIGGGVERRFGAWATSATLRLVGIGENKSVMTDTTAGEKLSRYGTSGGELVIGGTFYW